MQITVFGASGKIGKLVVERLLIDGHHVTVFVHSDKTYKDSDQLIVIKGDIHNAALVESAIQGSQVVISTLGSWHTPSKDILSAAMRFGLPAMRQAGISRIITLTGSGAFAPGDQLSTAGKLAHRVFGLIAKDIIRDAETHLQLLAESGLDWTCVRAPIMTNGGSATYKLNSSLPAAWATVTRAAVARAIVDQISDKSWLRQAPHIHNG